MATKRKKIDKNFPVNFRAMSTIIFVDVMFHIFFDGEENMATVTVDMDAMFQPIATFH